MKTPSDEELEWREEVYRAERADFERREHANRPFWMVMLGEIFPTTGEIALILFGLFVLFCGLLALVMPYIPTP